ncbi:MAG: DUF1638 domain-containing protein, partial [Gammaproteobacteria bacterium]|nr:DUF1638 domain-containing protein [Gammaproteobacteria bacterium]
DKRHDYEHIVVAYADCGTGGMLDKVLADYDIDRLPGAHCYEFFAGSAAFNELAVAEPGTFYLTDFLTRHFDRLVTQGLGLDKHPELMPQYFGNYKRLIYLAQSGSPDLHSMAEQHASYLDLDYERVYTDLEHMGHDISEKLIQWQN